MTDIDHSSTSISDPAVRTVVDARMTAISPEAAEELRRHVGDASGGGNRFVWFILGAVAAVVAGVVGSIAFLAVSDADDDGDVQLDVPAVDVTVDG